MKKALIDPTTQVQQITGWMLNPSSVGPKYLPVYTAIPDSARVAEVSDQSFEVAPPLFWADCGDEIVADQWYYDTVSQQFVVIPAPAPRPGTEGVQTV